MKLLRIFSGAVAQLDRAIAFNLGALYKKLYIETWLIRGTLIIKNVCQSRAKWNFIPKCVESIYHGPKYESIWF